MTKYRILNPITGEYSKDILGTELNGMRQEIIRQIRVRGCITCSNKRHKKVFSDLLLATNYFTAYKKQPVLTKDKLTNRLNTKAPEVIYDNSILNLDTGEIVRFFNDETSGYMLKIKNSVVTDFYIYDETRKYPWEQFNPTTMELEAYYESVVENGIEVEKKFLPSGELDSVAYRQGYDKLPDDFKVLLETYPQVDTKEIMYWARKSYGRTVAFVEDLDKLPDDPLAVDVKDEIVICDERGIADVASGIKVVQINFDGQGNEVWTAYDPWGTS